MESTKNPSYVKPKLKTIELAPVQCLVLFTKRSDRLGSEYMLPLSCNNSHFVDLTSQKLELYDESLTSSWNEFGVLGKIGIGKKDKNNSEPSIAIYCNEPTQDEFTFELLTGWPF